MFWSQNFPILITLQSSMKNKYSLIKYQIRYFYTNYRSCKNLKEKNQDQNPNC
jgi:hypothetical protein